MKKLHIKITFIEPVLGTANSNPDIHREFIASKAPDAKTREEEVATIGVEAAEEKATTIFSRDDDGNPVLWDYQIKGFFKEACGMLQRMKGEKCSKESCKLKAYKKIIDGCIEPAGEYDDNDGTMSRPIPIVLRDGDIIDIFQRPLRGQTAQGERIALASSERVPRYATATFYVITPDAYQNAIEEWLTYGRRHGLGQWRNSGHGRFVFEVLESVEV